MFMTRIAISLIFIAVCFQNLFAQKETKMSDLKLRQSFAKLFESDFEIVSDTVKPDKNGVKHWLVILKPRKEGFYTIRHIYKNRDGWGYKNNSSEFQISVGSKIDTRIFDYDNSHNLKQSWFDMWLGDEIVVPISLDEHIIKNEFSKESRFGANFNFDKEVKRENLVESNFLKKWNVENNVAELECLGISKIMIPTRSPGYSISHFATFRAKATGKFNLKIDDNLSIPVTILPADNPIKTLVGYKGDREWETGYESFSSIPYLLENATLRLGDILRIKISRSMQRGEAKKAENETGKIVFNKAAFSLKKTGYDYWIND
jgi:hypothetical protein